jgi:hypothetical protein
LKNIFRANSNRHLLNNLHDNKVFKA